MCLKVGAIGDPRAVRDTLKVVGQSAFEWPEVAVNREVMIGLEFRDAERFFGRGG
jgi:hypothetical protein